MGDTVAREEGKVNLLDVQPIFKSQPAEPLTVVHRVAVLVDVTPLRSFPDPAAPREALPQLSPLLSVHRQNHCGWV